MRLSISPWRFFCFWELFLFRNDSAALQMIPHDLSLLGVMEWAGIHGNICVCKFDAA
jgi:hypothetical protein